MDAVKHWADASAIGTTVATVAGLLPSISSLLAIIWLVIRIYESKTVQEWLKPQGKVFSGSYNSEGD